MALEHQELNNNSRLKRLDPKWGKEELLNQEGFFDFNEVILALGLDIEVLRSYLNRQKQIGAELPETFGIYGYQGQMERIWMARFRDVYGLLLRYSGKYVENPRQIGSYLVGKLRWLSGTYAIFDLWIFP